MKDGEEWDDCRIRKRGVSIPSSVSWIVDTAGDLHQNERKNEERERERDVKEMRSGEGKIWRLLKESYFSSVLGA